MYLRASRSHFLALIFFGSTLLLPFLAGASEPQSIASANFRDVQPLLEKHCFRCHNERKTKGNINLARFESEEDVQKEFKLWRRVLEQVATQEMPPDDESGFSPEHALAISKVVQQTLDRLQSADSPATDPGPSPLRRLSRYEYRNCVRDLFGLEVDFGSVGFPTDTTGSHFENTAAGLGISSSLLEKYFAAADVALTPLFGEPGLTAAERAEADRKISGRVRSARAAFFQALGKDGNGETALEFATAFARRAWRRSIEPSERELLHSIYQVAEQKGADEPERLRQMLKGILVSPAFLFREERFPQASGRAGKISQVELASRLSFFLWSSLPDEELLSAAERGELASSDVLRGHVRRMLRDPKAEALTDAMLMRWTGADRVLEARPSTEFFPDFNGQLRSAMRDETRLFFNYLRQEDRPVLDLLQSDYTFANSALAQHYGLKAIPTGKGMERVALTPDDHRGGILGMGSVLASTSHTFRTSPSQRGKWVLEVVFGTPPPPPPANAGLFKDDKKEKEPKDFREKLAQHAGDANCAGCHRRMDPLGFGLDNYDAVGHWREMGADLQTNGELPTGEKFAGASELRQVIWKRRPEFLRNLSAEMLTFALGRDLEYFDEAELSRIVRGMEAGDFRFSSLILGIVESFPFQNHRCSEVTGSSTTATR